MKMRVELSGMILGFATLGVVLPSGAATHWWQSASEGSWHDGAMWSPATEPTINDACGFSQAMLRPAHVYFGGTNATAKYILAEAPAGATSNNGTFTNTVYLQGNGETLTLAGNLTADYRRKIVVDHLEMPNTTNAQPPLNGKLSLVNKTNFQWGDQAYLAIGRSGTRFLVDDSIFRIFALSVYAGGGEFVIRHNADLQWERSWSDIATWAALKIDFTTGRVVTSPTYTLRNYGLLPKRPGGTLIARNTAGTDFLTTGDVVVRLGGSASFTNSWDTAFTFTNAVTVYGRGELAAGKTCAPTTTNTYDLSKIMLSRGVLAITTSDLPVTSYLGDTLFCVGGSVSPYWQFQGETRLVGGGTRTFDALENYGQAGRTRNLIISRLKANSRATTVITNAASMSVVFYQNDDTFGAFEIAPGIAVNTDKAYYYLKYPLDGLKMGAGSSLTLGSSQYNNAMVYGEAQFDSTATIVRDPGAQSAGAMPRALLSVLDKTATAPQFSLATKTEGWSVHEANGSYFYADDKYVTEEKSNVFAWMGREDGLWSNTNNWAFRQVPSDRTTYFHGFSHLTITNDLDNVKCYRLWTILDYYEPGPFLIRGKSISVTAADRQILNKGRYPFIVESDIVGTTTGDFEVSGTGDMLNPSPIVLRGNVSVANGSFSPDGQIVIDGAVTAKDLHFRNWTGRTYNYTGGDYPTKLRVGKTGSVTIASQTTVNSATGTFFIAKGGKVSIAGDLKWNTASNEHCVRGELAVSGALGGNATQGFFGAGVVKVGSLDGSEGASVKIGEGVTLATSAAGTTTMPLVLANGDATFAPQADLVLAGGVQGNALGHTLTISNACEVMVTGQVTGYDFDLDKTGSGRLELAEVPGLKRGSTTVREGTLAFTKSAELSQLTVASGAALEFVGEDGIAPTLTLDDNLALDGVTIKVSGEMAAGTWQTLVKVGEDLKITGTPTLADNLRTRVIQHVDDTVSFALKRMTGLTILVR